MKNKAIILFSLLFTFLALQGCEDDNDQPVPSDIAVNDFIWRGLNSYYLWQTNVQNLADNRFSNQTDFYNFLYNSGPPEVLFQNLLYKPASEFPADEAVDRFSVIFSDYNQLEGVLSGNTLNNGVDFGLKRKSANSSQVFGWVRYIIPNSDASTKEIYRGDLFYAVDGVPLTDDGNGNNNWVNLLYGENNTYTLNLADYNNGAITPNGRSVTLTKTNLSENPVLMQTVITNGSHKIGYLVYNAFYTGYENQLNDAFGALKSQGITDLVLDLRYNSGGSVDTATRLASMITGQFNGQLFARQQWNAKVEAYYEETNPSQFNDLFTSKLENGNGINSLNMTKIYILTSKSTASASELVINGLKPYIDVVQIGDFTTGKNVGSITLYDSPRFNKKNVNPEHRYAMQPLVLKIVNSDGFGDYTNGLEPDYLLKENLDNLDALGNPTEPLLSTAIGMIVSSGRMKKGNPEKTFDDVIDTKSIHSLKNGMYLNKVPENFMIDPR